MKKNLLCKVGALFTMLFVLSFSAQAQDCIIASQLVPTANPSTLCSGDVTALSVSVPGVGTEGVDIVWRLDATGEVLGNSISLSHAPVNTNCEPQWITYRVTATCPLDPAETKTQIIPVLVYPTLNATDPAANIDPIHLQYTADYSPEGCSVLIEPTCPYIVLSESNTVTLPPGSDTTVSFPYTYSYPSQGGLDCISGTFEVPVSCDPVCTATIQSASVSASDIVAGESVTLSANIIGSGDYVVTWSGSNGFSATGASAIDAPMSDYTGCEPMTITYTASVDCGPDTATLDTETVTVTVYPSSYETLYTSSTSEDNCTVTVTSDCGNMTISDGGVYTAGPGESGDATFTVSYDYPAGLANAPAATEVTVPYDCAALANLELTVDKDCNEVSGLETVTISITGGTGPYIITGDYNDDSYAEDVLPAVVFEDGTTWSISVTDSNGATATATGTVNCSKECTINGVQLSEVCDVASGQWTATATIPANAGTAPFSLEIDDAGASVTELNSNSFEISGLTNGQTYTITISDSSNDVCSTELTSTTAVCETVDIELLSFRGAANADANLLEWVTATETNNQFFTLERAADGINFETVATIDGNGTTNVATSYSFEDKHFVSGANYYRLSQTDYDGSTEICSEVILLQREESTFVISQLLPVPTVDELHIILTSSESIALVATVYDITGRLVLSQLVDVETGSNDIEINTSDLSTGTYLLTIANGPEISTKKFTRQ